MPSDSLPIWLATEGAVRRFFELLGFVVENVAIGGRQIDLVATRPDTLDLAPERWVIEVTTERVGAQKGAEDYQKLDLARRTAYPGARTMIVTTAGFTDDQKATLKSLSVVPLTYSELESRQLNLLLFAHQSLSGLRAAPSTDIGYNATSFIEPELCVRKGGTDGDRISAHKWMEDLLGNPVATVCALLGNLGSGKTSLLQRLVEVGCQRFLESPNDRVLPIFVPLGRYKQHSGDLEQMLMSEFRRTGQQSYPAALVRHLIDQRRIILLLDGLDEIHPLQNSEDVLETVAGLLTSIGKEAAAVVSCRRQFLETTDAELAYFGSYTASHLRSIQAGIARQLRGWPSTYIAEVVPFDRPRIDLYLERRCHMAATEVEDLFARFYGFSEMAQTPVLLAMMATTVHEGSLDPTKADPFPLLTLYQAYTNRWIERDVGRALLSKEQRRKLSIALAEHMLWKGRESEPWAYLREVLREEDAWKGNPLPDEQVELDVRTSGFLVRDLDNRYRFIHRSIMEYFAADAERVRLEHGDRPRHFPTDGFRLFLVNLLAHQWRATGVCPVPHRSWDQGRGESVIEAQMSLLAAASVLIPDGALVDLSEVHKVRTSTTMQWKGVRLRRLEWRHAGGDLRFRGCAFHDVEIVVENGSHPTFENCTFAGTRLVFLESPSWSVAGTAVHGPRLGLGLPGQFWELSELADQQAEIVIAGRRWSASIDTLDLCAQAWQRVGRGKIAKDNFARGTRATELSALLDTMVREGLIEEDTSRTGHQLEGTQKFRSFIGTLASDPIAAQATLDVFTVGKRRSR